MKRMIKTTGYVMIAIALGLSACKKDKKTDPPSTPPAETPTPPEVITTLRVYIYDSLGVPLLGPFSFKDPDGDGGQPGGFLNGGADSVITLNANTTYYAKVVILDETKTPTDSTSNEVAGDESYEHMFFYNGDPANAANNKGNAILNAGYPGYKVKLNGSNIIITYADTDNGAAHGQPTRNIGLFTKIRTYASTGGAKYPLIATLRHQPEAKDGTYAPGETDVEVSFKVKVN